MPFGLHNFKIFFRGCSMAKLKPEDVLLNERISQRIKELRTAQNSNQSEFAQSHCIDRQTLHRWENGGEKRGVSIHTVQKFCGMIGISLKDFFDSPLFKKEP